jgi:glutamate-1-semialdehyde 2,1-aminomutase
VAYGGAQKLFAVKPDLTTLGKVVGGGLPCAAYGGREEIMRKVAPDGPMYQAGTLSGNPLAMAAGIAMLEALRDGAAYERIERASHKLEAGLESAAKKAGVPVQVARVGSMITPFFSRTRIENWEQAKHADTKAFARFFGVMLDEGVVLPPSQYETWFLSTEHDDAVIEETIAAAEKAFAAAAG